MPGVKGDEGSGGEPGTEAGNADSGPLGTLYNWLNVALISGSLLTGLFLLFRRTRQVVGRRAHRIFGATLVALFVVDLMVVTGPSGLQNLVERVNLVLLTVLAVTSLYLYLKPRRLWAGSYLPVRNVHVIFAMIYAAKFFAEPLLGGKLG